MAAPLAQLTPNRQLPRNVRRPNLGLYLNRNSFEMDPRALAACNNARIKDGEISTQNLGWEPFPEGIGEGNQYNLDALQVLLIAVLATRNGTRISIFANQRDLFFHDTAGPTLKYLTPIYATGTVDNTVSNMQIDGTGTLWATNRLTVPITGAYGDNALPGMFISFGSATEVLPTATWHEIDTVTNDTTLTILTDPGLLGGATTYTIRQIFTGDNNNLWDGEIFPNAQTAFLDTGAGGNRAEDTIYLTNGIEMAYWDGNTTQATWFFPGFVAGRLKQHRRIMLASDILEAGQLKPSATKTSAINFPENFATEEASEFVSANGISRLQTLEPLGDAVIAYYQLDIEILTFVGPPIFWLIRSAVPGTGVLAPGFVADQGDFHEFLSIDAAYRFDGVGIREVMPQVMREVLRTIDPNRSDRGYVHIDHENGEALWSLPLSTDGGAVDSPPVSALSEHYLESLPAQVPTPVMKRDFPFTAIGRFIRDTGAVRFSDLNVPGEHEFDKLDFAWNDRALQAAFPFTIVGDGNGDIWILGTRSTKGEALVQPDSSFTSSMVSSVTFPDFAWIDGERNGHMQWLEPFANAGGNVYDLQYTITTKDRFAAIRGVSFTDTDFDLSHGSVEESDGSDQPDRRIGVRLVGRYGNVQFENDPAIKGSFFICSGYRTKIRPRGDR